MDDSNKKILLLVEDEALIAMAKKMELEEYGYTVLTVDTGEKAVAQSKENRDIDLILMDIDLGAGIDGTEAAKIILNSQDLPIIFLSSHMEREIVEKTEKITSYGYVVKSSSITVIDASIKMAFKLFNAHIEINKRNMQIERVNENLRVTVDKLEEINSKLNVTNDALICTEANLQKSEKEYKSTVEGLLVGVIVHDIDSNIILSNPEASKLLGLTVEQLIGKKATDPAWKFIYEDSTPMKLEDYPVNRVISTHKPLMNYVAGVICPDRKDITWLNVNAKPLFNVDNKLEKIVVNFADITEQKLAEKRLKKSEATIKNKLKALTETDGEIDSLELSDIINTEALQSLMEDFYNLTGMLGAVLDISGKILIAVGWQDICTKFHRCNPETRKNCIESDTILTQGVPEGTFKSYHCKNNMWDTVTPLIIGGRHVGNIFMGQYFLEEEVPDITFFRKNARKYGFDEEEYLAALKRVPRFSKDMIKVGMQFYSKLAKIISTLSFSTIKQSRLLADRAKAESNLLKNQYYLSKAQELGKIGTWELDIKNDILFWTEENYKIFGVPIGTKINYDMFLDYIYPEDLESVNKMWIAGLEKEPYDIEHRIISNGTVKWVREKAEIEFDEADNPVRAIGFTQDITDRKIMGNKIKLQLEEKEFILKEIHHRIKNNFASISSLLSLQSKSLTNPEAISALNDAVVRVNSMKVMYEKMLLTGNYKTASSKTYLDNLIDDLAQFFPKDIDIRTEKSIDDFMLDSKQLIPVGFIVNELLTNIMKYSFTNKDFGLIEVVLKEHSGNVVLTVKDNGNGLPEGFDIDKSKGFGLMLIKMLVQQLNGSFTMENETGLKTIITFNV